MAQFSILGALSTVQIALHTLFHGRRVGQDQIGNIYYTGKARKGQKRERRWVVYKNHIDASEVPAEWHGWLHHQTDILPSSSELVRLRKPWQKPHRANKTGTAEAYYPKGHVLSGAKRAKATGDYEAWTPEQ